MEARKPKPFGHKWPVTFANPDVHSIYYVIEHCVREGKFQEIPCCQLITARVRDFAYMQEKGGYGYFQVDYKSGKWEKLSRSQFDELLKEYRKYTNLWVQSKEYFVSKEYLEHSPTNCTIHSHSIFCDFLKAYYPDCKDAIGAVFVLGNKEGLPLVQIRMKRENNEEYWSAYYPRDNKCVTLSDFSWEYLIDFSKSGGTVVQVQPRCMYGKLNGHELELFPMPVSHQIPAVRIGHTFVRLDQPPIPKPMGWDDMSLSEKISVKMGNR